MIGRRHDLGVTYEKYQFQNTWILWSTEEYWNKQHVLFIGFGFLQITVRITKKHLAILGPRKWKSCWSGNKNMDCTGAFFSCSIENSLLTPTKTQPQKHALHVIGSFNDSWKTQKYLLSYWESNSLLHSIILQKPFGLHFGSYAPGQQPTFSCPVQRCQARWLTCKLHNAHSFVDTGSAQDSN